jgi:hypothetical protein
MQGRCITDIKGCHCSFEKLGNMKLDARRWSHPRTALIERGMKRGNLVVSAKAMRAHS